MEDETRLIKSIASTLLGPILKTEFYNDAEDYINYKDPETKKEHRSEKEIKKMEDLIKKEKDDILDETVEILKENGYTNIIDISENALKVRDLINKESKNYRRRLWDAIKP